MSPLDMCMLIFAAGVGLVGATVSAIKQQRRLAIVGVVVMTTSIFALVAPYALT